MAISIADRSEVRANTTRSTVWKVIELSDAFPCHGLHGPADQGLLPKLPAYGWYACPATYRSAAPPRALGMSISRLRNQVAFC